MRWMIRTRLRAIIHFSRGEIQRSVVRLGIFRRGFRPSVVLSELRVSTVGVPHLMPRFHGVNSIAKVANRRLAPGLLAAGGLLGLLLGLTGPGCSGRDDHRHPQLTTGRQLFDHHCADCHAKSGKGLFWLGVPSNADTQLSREEVALKIRRGALTEHRMPMFQTMSYREADQIAGYLMQLGRD